MPLLKKLTVNKSKSILVWQMDEALDFFTSGGFDKKISMNRQIEKSCSKHVLKEFFGINQLAYDIQGKPITNQLDKLVSISHSKKRLAVAVYDEPVGVDIELISEKATRIKKKFLNPNDCKCPPEVSESLFYTLLWAVKESIFKKYSEKEHLIFSEQIWIDEIKMGKGQMTAMVGLTNEKDRKEDLGFEIISDYVLVFTL